MSAKKPLKYFLNRIYRGSSRNFGAVAEGNIGSSSQHLINLEYEYSAHNYHPIPIVFSQAKGASIWDPEGNKYLDFLSAYSAVNQGHCHPKVMKALVQQAERLALSSRAFFNDRFPVFAECLTSMFGYDMVLPMNTGAEGVETALKLARKWGYEKKRIPEDEAIIVSCCGCFHGRTLAVISMSCDNEATRGFGPLLPGHLKVDFGDQAALEKIFKDTGKSTGWWSDTCKCSACRQRCYALHQARGAWKVTVTMGEERDESSMVPDEETTTKGATEEVMPSEKENATKEMTDEESIGAVDHSRKEGNDEEFPLASPTTLEISQVGNGSCPRTGGAANVKGTGQGPIGAGQPTEEGKSPRPDGPGKFTDQGHYPIRDPT